MGKRVSAVLKRIPYLEAFRAFLEQWGVWGYLVYIAALASAGALALWGWLETHLPNWGIALLFLATVVLVLASFHYGVEVYRKITSERLDHGAIADQLISLSEEMSRAVNDYARELTLLKGRGPVDLTPEQEWFKRRGEGKLMVQHISERFGQRIIAAMLLMRKLEVKIPFHLSHMDEYSLMGLSAYFGAVGHLIKTGNLSAAQTMDNDAAWAVSNIIG